MALVKFRPGMWAFAALMATGAAAGVLDEKPKDRTCRGARSAIPAAPFNLRYKLDVGWEHGCSRSMESFGEVGSLEIEVDARGKAVLRLDLFHAHTFGPSEGECERGGCEFFHNDSRYRAVWTGKAERTETGLLLRFIKKEISNQLWGSDFKPERTEKTGLTLSCTAGTLLLDPPVREPKSPPECAPVVMCKPSVPILSFRNERVRELSSRLYFQGSLPFAAKPGLEANVERLYSTGWEYLHRAER